MRQLNRNYWRLSWILLVNTALVVLQLTGPVRAQQDRQAISRAMRTATPEISYWRVVFLDPWTAITMLLLLAGIVAELRRSAFSLIFNLAPFALWFGLAIRDPFYSRQLLIISVLITVIVVNAGFYFAAFRHRAHEA